MKAMDQQRMNTRSSRRAQYVPLRYQNTDAGVLCKLGRFPAKT